jgi:serine protease Do
LKFGYVSGKPKLGISCQTVSDTTGVFFGVPIEGAQVTSIEAGGAADEAGIIIGDIITGINGAKISTTDDLTGEKNKYFAGDTITLRVFRNGEELDIPVVLADVNATSA